MRCLPTPAAVFAGLLPLLLCACANFADSGDPRAIAAGETFRMAAGEQAAMADGSTLRYLRVGQDSRCPVHVQCVWAGDAEAVFEWAHHGVRPQTFSLHTGRGARSHDIGMHRLTLESLERGDKPAALLRLEATPQAGLRRAQYRSAPDP